jgi:hypothetical protein
LRAFVLNQEVYFVREMRQILVTFAALILMALPPAHAQTRQGGARPAPPPTMPPAQPTVPPPITYPFGPLMSPPAGGLTPRVGEGTPFNTQRSRFFRNGSTLFAPFIFGYQDPTEPVSGRAPRPSVPPLSTGLLRLAVTPAGAQVFVDTYYVGTVDDVNAQRVLELEAGPHRLEFRAPGYLTLTVDLRILPYETVTYRGALELARPPAPATPPAAVPPTVMYVIPNCYLGNLPPRQSRLPPGCDVKQVQVLKPTATASR